MDKGILICGIVAGGAVGGAIAGTAGSIIGAGVAHWFTSYASDVFIVAQVFGVIAGFPGLLLGALFGKVLTTGVPPKTHITP